MSKQVYISADYDLSNGDRDVVNELNKWGSDAWHKVDFIDMSKVASGSVANGNDCRICDLKAEFNRQINASSAVIFVVGDMTGSRTAGSGCERATKIRGSALVHRTSKIPTALRRVRFLALLPLVRMKIMAI